MLKSRMGLLSKGLFFMVSAMCLGFLISYIYSQITYKTDNGIGTKLARLTINQGANTVSIDITNAYLNMNNNKISNLADPTDPKDAATKNYVDSTVGSGGVVPSGAILLFLSTGSCPTGYTDVTTTYNLSFPIACNTTIGGLDCTTGVITGGSLDHKHSVFLWGTTSTDGAHQHTVSSGWAGKLHSDVNHGSGSNYCFGGNDPTSVSTASAGSHSHEISLRGTAESSNPPYFTVILCKKD
jgi:hypothetical protein